MRQVFILMTSVATSVHQATSMVQAARGSAGNGNGNGKDHGNGNGSGTGNGSGSVMGSEGVGGGSHMKQEVGRQIQR